MHSDGPIAVEIRVPGYDDGDAVVIQTEFLGIFIQRGGYAPVNFPGVRPRTGAHSFGTTGSNRQSAFDTPA